MRETNAHLGQGKDCISEKYPFKGRERQKYVKQNQMPVKRNETRFVKQIPIEGKGITEYESGKDRMCETNARYRQGKDCIYQKCPFKERESKNVKQNHMLVKKK